MRAVVFERHGGPEVLEYRELPDPVPGPDQVLVQVDAAGVNYRDVYERSGEEGSGPLPAVGGVEGAGVVVGTGQRVAWMNVPGSYSELVAADRDRLVPVPDGVPSDVAAAALMQGITAHYLSSDSYPVQRGDWVVVHAAAGGVGQLLTQLAARRGGRVLGTTSTAAKAAIARESGAEEVIGYEGFSDRVRDLSGEGAAAVYDGVGRSTFAEGLRSLRPLGRMIIYGSSSGQPDPVEVMTLADHGSLYLQRPTIRTYIRTPELLRERARTVFELIAAGDLTIRIGRRYPLAEARQAHEDLEARSTTGKLVLSPAPA